MPKKKKTRSEKIKSGYRLDNFTLKVDEKASAKDKKEFAYLDKQYVGKDLLKTLIFSALILGMLIAAKRWLG